MGTHIQDEREFHVSPWLRLSRNYRWSSGSLPSTAGPCRRFSCGAYVLRREIVFDHEPLERVAAEYNRYIQKPIEIATPALRNLQISGVFATDDTDAFIAFLRSLKGVRVEVTQTQIRVW